MTSSGTVRNAEAAHSPVTSPPTSPTELVFPPPTESTVSLEVALGDRRSVRVFDPDPLTEAEIGQLLWATQGITADSGARTAPSAGGTYPLELYAVTADRLMHYVPDGHRAEVTASRD